MAIVDANLYFTGVGTSGFSPTATGDNIAPFTVDTSPLTLPSGSGGGGAIGYNSGVTTNAGRDLGIGGEMWLEVTVTAAATSGGSATVDFRLVTDSTATIASVTTLLSSGATAVASLGLSTFFRAQLPASAGYKQFLGLNCNIATATLTAGTFEGKLLINIQQSDLYQSGFFVQ